MANKNHDLKKTKNYMLPFLGEIKSISLGSLSKKKLSYRSKGYFSKEIRGNKRRIVGALKEKETLYMKKIKQ